MVLLLFVLSGLLVMRRRDGVTFGLARLLWKQVLVVVLLIHNFLILTYSFVRESFGSYSAASLRSPHL